MINALFINLPVSDLKASKAFFSKLGFSFNDQFSDDTAIAMVIAENISAMLLTHAKFADFTPKAIVQAHQQTEVLNALQVESRAEVDRIVDAAMAAGAGAVKDAQDHGFMYGRSFADLDGHIWEILWMDPTQIPTES